MSIQEIGIIVGLGITALASIFSIYDRFFKADIKAEGDINLLQQGCKFRHDGLNKDITDINERFDRMEKNHINHMETDLRSMNITQTKILTILEAKYQIKIE